MPFNFVRTGFANTFHGKTPDRKLILNLTYQDSPIQTSQEAPRRFVGEKKPHGSMAVTFQNRGLNEITYAANDCFIGRGETFELPVIYADEFIHGDAMHRIVSEEGARFMLEQHFKTGVVGLAQVRDDRLMPVGPTHFVLDKNSGAILTAPGGYS